ncbi:MAG: hypothetical protein KGH79_02795 [Patescibacteria group bacterium]|nr:hypothetical protein [Patescibacteria group bacterium]
MGHEEFGRFDHKIRDLLFVARHPFSFVATSIKAEDGINRDNPERRRAWHAALVRARKSSLYAALKEIRKSERG